MVVEHLGPSPTGDEKLLPILLHLQELLYALPRDGSPIDGRSRFRQAIVGALESPDESDEACDIRIHDFVEPLRVFAMRDRDTQEPPTE